MATTNIQSFGGNVGIGTNDPGAYKLYVNGGTSKAGAIEVTSLTVSGVENAYANIGVIAMWSGSVASIPDGWELCDGSTYSKSDGSGNITSPNLSGRFILGYDGVTYNVGATGGSFTNTLTTSNLPGHTHSVSTGTGGSHAHPAFSTANSSHAHPAVISSVGNHNHYYTTGGFIMNYSPTGQWYACNPGYRRGGGNHNQNANDSRGDHSHSLSMASAATHNHTITVASGGAHTHPVTIGSSTSNESTISTIPSYYVLCFIIKI
jgi:microcystin-dependent protein